MILIPVGQEACIGHDATYCTTCGIMLWVVLTRPDHVAISPHSNLLNYCAPSADVAKRRLAFVPPKPNALHNAAFGPSGKDRAVLPTKFCKAASTAGSSNH